MRTLRQEYLRENEHAAQAATVRPYAVPLRYNLGIIMYSRVKITLGTILSVQLAFATKSLRDLCESEIKIKKKLRSDVANVLQHRLADLSAASSMADLVASPPVQLDGASGKRYGIDLCGGHRLVIRPNHLNVSRTGSGDIDWRSVNRVQILSIE